MPRRAQQMRAAPKAKQTAVMKARPKYSVQSKSAERERSGGREAEAGISKSADFWFLIYTLGVQIPPPPHHK